MDDHADKHSVNAHQQLTQALQLVQVAAKHLADLLALVLVLAVVQVSSQQARRPPRRVEARPAGAGSARGADHLSALRARVLSENRERWLWWESVGQPAGAGAAAAGGAVCALQGVRGPAVCHALGVLGAVQRMLWLQGPLVCTKPGRWGSTWPLWPLLAWACDGGGLDASAQVNEHAV